MPNCWLIFEKRPKLAAMLTLNQITDFCEKLHGTEETYPFGEEHLVYKVGGKMYLLIDVYHPESMNLKCDPDFAQELRVKYASVTPGYHMNKKHWNTVHLDGTVQDIEILSWIKHSYDLVFQSLSKKLQSEILSQK